MEQKMKFFLIGLVGVAAACFFLFIQSFSAKQKLLQEKNDLQAENTTLNAKIGKLENSLRNYENKMSQLNKEMDQVSLAKQEAEKKYELASQEKEELQEALKKLKARETQSPVVSIPQPQAMATAGTDSYWAAILKAKTELELQLNKLQSDFKTTQINNEQLQREKSTTELEINNLKREKEELGRQLSYNQKLMDSLAQELVREKNDKIQIQESLKSLKAENALLFKQSKGLNNQKINLEKRLQAIEQEKASLGVKLNQMQTTLAENIPQVDTLREELMDAAGGLDSEAATGQPATRGEFVELPAIVVRPPLDALTQETNLAAGQALAGKVLAINKDNNFVVIDMGQDRGLKTGDVFHIYREAKAIASIEVNQTRKDISACDIKQEKTPIKIGDIVRQ